MTTYSDYEQRQLDIATSAAMDRRNEAAAIIAEARNLNLYHECMAAIRRAADAYAYLMGTCDSDTANRMIHELEEVAGWFVVEAIDISWVHERAVSAECGQWKDFPGSLDVAADVAAYVADTIDRDTSGTTDFALQKFFEFAENRGIMLEEQEEVKF